MTHSPHQPTLASGHTHKRPGERVFFIAPLAANTRPENAHRYGGLASRATYIESDPTGLDGGSFSTYAYVAGNPVSEKDPLGLTEQDVNIIQHYINQNFPDIHRSAGYLFGDLGEDVAGTTGTLTGITVLPRDVRCKLLSQDEFNQLFDTMLHESMHSTDPIWQRAWDSLWGNDYNTMSANHRSIYNRTAYELVTGHKFSVGPM